MSTLITATYVKANFEQWETYCTVEGSAYTADQILEAKIDLAEIEFLEYIRVDATTVTGQHKRHMLIIAKKNCFDIKHGNTEFESKPLIVKDYENTLAALQKYQLGELAAFDADSDTDNDLPRVSITAKTRRFDTWFNEEAGE